MRHQCATLLMRSDYRLVQVDADGAPEERVQALRWRLKDI